MSKYRVNYDQLTQLTISGIRMMNQARNRDEPFRLTRGQGHQLPFADSSFDLVYCVNAIHPFCRCPPVYG